MSQSNFRGDTGADEDQKRSKKASKVTANVRSIYLAQCHGLTNRRVSSSLVEATR